MSRSRIARVALAGLVLAGAAGAARARVSQVPPSDARASAAASYSPSGGGGAQAVPGRTPPTTAPAIALANLNAEIADRERRDARGEERVEPELVGRYLARARFEGRVADLVAADEKSARMIAARPADARAHLTRAKALSAIHEFAAAGAELDSAARLGAEASEVAAQRGALLLAVGREDEAAALLEAHEVSSPEDLAMRAGVEARLGHEEASHRFFDAARAHYRDVSPFVLAWVDFERARALEEEGHPVAAKPWLEEAVAVLPTYAHAVVHLAALEPAGTALARLQALEGTSDDPEVLAAEADALRRAGRKQEAAAVTARAAARYDEVLARLPKAYGDHAAAFYLGVGADAARALDLARANASNRPTAEAAELWLTSARAAGSREQTCAAAALVQRLAHAHESLRKDAREACP